MGLQGYFKSRNIVQSSIVMILGKCSTIGVVGCVPSGLRDCSWYSLDIWRVTLVSSADAAGHLHRRQALPALLRAGLWQAAALFCGVWRRPGSRLWRQHGHAHAGRAWGEQPGLPGVTWLDLAVHPQEASRSALLATPVDKLTQTQRQVSNDVK